VGRPASRVGSGRGATYQQLIERLESGDSAAPPSERIAAYVNALLDRWPDITDDQGEDSPWADGPMIGNAFGDAIYFSIVWSRADEASAFAAQLAEQHGLICYDPQSEALLPRSAESQRKKRRPWFNGGGWPGASRRQ
jgi:hypothetical protein